ncbi:hypothetical protein BDV95DRAFT_492061 [Massariosphaeria phaeospora]|uniref:C2H2-type domain-containing protein n=1 Tax=Massariosphaeria phaeospora TaxID=100035 RepID=A0A7C8IF65_9PLEO|nr:hypothetical protein BDV95DRAFT_492061 [Massariosphaeria phaeospora]
MLVLPQRRQHLPQQPISTLPSPPSSQQQFSFEQLSQQLAAQDYLNSQKLLHDYLDSQQQHSFANSVVADTETNPYMTNAYTDFSHPTIRIQQSTPAPQLASGFSQPPMLHANVADWSSYNVQSDQSLQTPVQSQQGGRTHQRASSSSSIGSAGSQYTAAGVTGGYQYVAHSEKSPSTSATIVESSYSADEHSRTFSNHLPTPTHTPTHDTFMNTNNFNSFTPNTGSVDSTMAAHFSMKQALIDQQDDDVPGFGHSARHSVSSHDSPATPRTAQLEDQEYKQLPTGKTLSRVDSWLFDQFCTYDEIDVRQQYPVPKLARTLTDVANDNFYDPMAQSQPVSQHKPARNGLLSPYRSNNGNDIIRSRLQAADAARSQSPASAASRAASPFRRSSPMVQPSNTFSSPRMGVGSAALAREQKVEADAAHAMKTSVSPREDTPKTISPKEALLDYREADEDSKVPLFPDSGASEYDHQYNGGDQYRNATQSNFDTTPGQSYQRDSWATPQYSSNFATSSAATSQPISSFAFATPAVSGGMHSLPNYSSTSHYRSVPNTMPATSEQAPEFPAHLTSMESSASEAEPASQSSDHLLQKPAPSTSESGTYTCTYHGCTLRFETPQKLQKHKREGHRNANPASISTSMTSAAILERNSQAGPHKCSRTNPITHKPCNTIFSRPYDLTRHEDTIHNVRKQKVRCALCVEEKTFSRNDALTRHMRVVHPEVDFPGKHRRRGGNHD